MVLGERKSIASTDFPWAIDKNESLQPAGRKFENCAVMSFVQMHGNDLRVWICHVHEMVEVYARKWFKLIV